MNNFPPKLHLYNAITLQLDYLSYAIHKSCFNENYIIFNFLSAPKLIWVTRVDYEYHVKRDVSLPS